MVILHCLSLSGCLYVTIRRGYVYETERMGYMYGTMTARPSSRLEHRPVYHLQSQGAEAGWVSDPNGPIFYKGRYHMFCASPPPRCGHSSGKHWPLRASERVPLFSNKCSPVQRSLTAGLPRRPGSHDGADARALHGGVLLLPHAGPH
jgi:hypothetical protein